MIAGPQADVSVHDLSESDKQTKPRWRERLIIIIISRNFDICENNVKKGSSCEKEILR